ncbi:DNA-3-methyladenine glycosylase 2 [Escherichia coli]|nr:DNA-3-methyladenine glycosylase 2 [Escherichia coli]EGO9647262.1 DNA-3-methyladenine glycosylase 2 [Escherichia coli]EGP5927009.1 DNA-3-methyladenine glycosylase 2 [Escherichia coli]EHL1362468.1 DNA-3-methyladenine glycosylase 2 [Escherichia coli]EJO9642871.1 DNA-3-methyladenine glycosylase 2 [Escherichia coli]
MYTLNWQPPYDWSWMLGFLAARAVSGVETVAEDYYARSLAVGEYRGVVTAIPDIARHTLHINLSAGLEPVAAECLAKMSRLFDLQCNPQALKALGMPLKRAEALIHLANAALEGSLPMTIPGDVEQAMKTLQTFPGIGRWTANYFALRGWQAKDVFLPDDYLIKQRFPGMTPAQIRRYAERWKPWRSYALLHIWYTEGWQPDGTDEL